MADALRILVHSSNPDPLLDRIRAVAPDHICEGYDNYDGMAETLAAFKPDAVYSVAFAGRQGFPRDALLGADGPKWISIGGSGSDHLRPWDEDQVTVTNSAGVAADMMAEYAFGAAFHFLLDIPGLQADRVAKVWNPKRLVTPLKGKTMLIIGLGKTGQAVAKRAQAFGMHVLGTRARPAPMDHIDEVHPSDQMLDLIPRADVIVVAVPLLPTTKGFLSDAHFAAMKDSTILIDVSRGGVIESAALLHCLQEKRIAGAALDVFEVEPLPAESPFWELDNIILSPHSSSVYDGWEMASFEMFLENLSRWQNGETLTNIVSPIRGY